jgi:hypothetical protein
VRPSHPLGTLILVLLTGLAVVIGPATPAAARSSSARAVRVWARAHTKVVTALGNDINAFTGALVAGEHQCLVLIVELGRATRLPKIPSPGIRRAWQTGLTDLAGGGSGCVEMTTKAESNLAFANIENGAQAFRTAAAAMRKDGATFHFRSGTSGTSEPASTT